MKEMIRLENISFSYGDVEAIRDVSLTLPAGIFGLLGPNGAGKTTLMKLLLGFLQPDSGSGEIMGQALTEKRKSLRRGIGYMPESDCLIAGHGRRLPDRLPGRAERHAAPGSHEKGPRCPVLRRPGGVALPPGGDLFHGHEAAAEAGPGPGARPAAAAARRAHLGHGSRRPQGDAGTHPRHRQEGEHEHHHLLAPAARHREHLPAGGHHEQGPHRGRRVDRRAEEGRRNVFEIRVVGDGGGFFAALRRLGLAGRGKGPGPLPGHAPGGHRAGGAFPRRPRAPACRSAISARAAPRWRTPSWT